MDKFLEEGEAVKYFVREGKEQPKEKTIKIKKLKSVTDRKAFEGVAVRADRIASCSMLSRARAYHVGAKATCKQH